MADMEQNLYIFLGVMCVIAGIVWVSRLFGWRRQRWYEPKRFAKEIQQAARQYIDHHQYRYEYTHRVEGDHVVYEFNIHLLSDFNTLGGPDWEMGDVRVKELNGEPIPPEQQCPWLIDWDDYVVDMAEAELIAAGGPCITDYDHSFDDIGDWMMKKLWEYTASRYQEKTTIYSHADQNLVILLESPHGRSAQISPAAEAELLAVLRERAMRQEINHETD